ncbi:protein of unknown function (plasmid) [Cupriavidus taiwanensis]|nr:protein of unknown function [Cupriavidus taiwanensis]
MPGDQSLAARMHSVKQPFAYLLHLPQLVYAAIFSTVDSPRQTAIPAADTRCCHIAGTPCRHS